MTQEDRVPGAAVETPDRGEKPRWGLFDRVVAVGKAGESAAADVRFIQEHRELIETILNLAHDKLDYASKVINDLRPVLPLAGRDVTVHEESGEAWSAPRTGRSTKYAAFTSDRRADVVSSHGLWTLYVHGSGPNTSQGRAIGRKVIKRFPDRESAEREAVRWLTESRVVSWNDHEFTPADLR